MTNFAKTYAIAWIEQHSKNIVKNLKNPTRQEGIADRDSARPVKHILVNKVFIAAAILKFYY